MDGHLIDGRRGLALLALLGATAIGACATDAPAPPPARDAATHDARRGDPWFEAGRETVARVRAELPARSSAKNAILFVGDGMGPTTVTAARIHAGQLAGGPGEDHWLSFERLPHVALARTFNTNLQVPDSAGTMTAMVSGVKTKAAVLGVSDAVVPGDHTSVARSRVPTLCEEAEARGLRTGIVTTTRITHATPAACYAHAPHRNWEDDASLSDAARADGFPDLARQFVEFGYGDGIEVVLGGGRAQFLPTSAHDPEEPERTGRRRDGRDLVAEWTKAAPGRAWVWNAAQLAAVDPDETSAVLGLFDPSHMEWELDRAGDVGGEPSLSEMTAFAIDFLARGERGYVLVVEAGRIDHAHHAGNAVRALTDTVELSRAVETALARVDLAETLVIVTADHGHTLAFAGYPKRGNPILGKVVGLDPKTGAPTETPTTDGQGRPYTTLSYANGPGHHAPSQAQPEGAKRYPHFAPPGSWSDPVGGRPDLGEVDTTDPDYLQSATVPMIAETHGGQDVAIYAGGPGSELVRGVVDQQVVYHVIVEALGWNADGPAAVSETGRPTEENLR